MKMNILNAIYYVMGLWAIYSIYLFIKLSKNGKEKINLRIYYSIPTVFTTLGVLGTFIGIFIGLQKFDVHNISDSIPTLLEGLKTAFLTSIIGIILAIIFRFIAQSILFQVEKNTENKIETEIDALQKILQVLNQSYNGIERQFSQLLQAINKSNEYSLDQYLIMISREIKNLNENAITKNSLIEESIENQKKTIEKLEKLDKIISTSNEISNDIKQVNQSIIDGNKSINENIEQNANKLSDTLKNSSDGLKNKFDEFGEILKENNTKALVEVMQQATETFNAHMNELIERLVKENFEELNKSVERLNTWQQDNKEMIEKLTEQYQKVSEEFQITAEAIKEITENTKQLTDENSHLVKLIEELQKVMIDDRKFEEIINNLSQTIETIKKNTEAFDETTNKLNDWIRKERNFRDAVEILISRLEEIEKIKDINEEFWSNTKKQLNEGVATIANASRELRDNLDDISEEFTEELNKTLRSLDELIQRLIQAAIDKGAIK